MKTIIQYFKCFIGLHDWGPWIVINESRRDRLDSDGNPVFVYVELCACKCGDPMMRIRGL